MLGNMGTLKAVVSIIIELGKECLSYEFSRKRKSNSRERCTTQDSSIAITSTSLLRTRPVVISELGINSNL